MNTELAKKTIKEKLKLDYIILEKDSKIIYVDLLNPTTKKIVKSFDSEKKLFDYLTIQTKPQPIKF